LKPKQQENNMHGLWKMLGRLGRRKLEQEIMVRIPELSKDKLLEGMAVDPENPLLVSIMHVLKGMEEIAKENVSVARQDPHEKAHYGGAIAALGEAQERIADLVVQANKRKRGEGDA
jgi:hypothetical protein